MLADQIFAFGLGLTPLWKAPCVREVVASSEIHLRGPEGRCYGVLTGASRTCSSKDVDER
jgi:hypothetical protein